MRDERAQKQKKNSSPLIKMERCQQLFLDALHARPDDGFFKEAVALLNSPTLTVRAFYNLCCAEMRKFPIIRGHSITMATIPYKFQTGWNPTVNLALAMIDWVLLQNRTGNPQQMGSKKREMRSQSKSLPSSIPILSLPSNSPLPSPQPPPQKTKTTTATKSDLDELQGHSALLNVAWSLLETSWGVPIGSGPQRLASIAIPLENKKTPKIGR